MTFIKKRKKDAQAIEETLSQWLVSPELEAASVPKLTEAMRYAVLGSGKRFRPLLVLESAALFGLSPDKALNTAAAIECVHCYSLIHDDLPAMDGDQLRRGRPTLHIAFDEATAILAGDALLTLAFEILGHPSTHDDATVRSELILTLAQAAGKAGMVGGQMLDLLAEGQTLDAEAIYTMQALKTGALIHWSCAAGAILAGASPDQRQVLHCYAEQLGLGFQIADDLLDHEGNYETTGKATGKDFEAGKATVVSLMGAKEAHKRLTELEVSAIQALDIFGEKASAFIEAARFVTKRRY